MMIDKRAFEEIKNIYFSKENEQLSFEDKNKKVLEVLEELNNTSYLWGVRQGIFKSINLLTKEVEE